LSAPLIRDSKLATVAAILAFTCAISVISYRGSFYLADVVRPDGKHWVMQDFRDVVYFPSRAFLDGLNPYNVQVYMEHYPVWHPVALYTPLSILMSSPFALLPFSHAWQLYYVFSLLLMFVLAALSLRAVDLPATPARVTAVATLILLSRPGQMNLLLGQVALQCAIATCLAVFYDRRYPWLAAAGLAFTTGKPSYGALLGILLLCRGDFRLVLRGILLAIGPTLLGAWILLQRAGSLAALYATAHATYNVFGTEQFDDPVFGPFRIDAPALIARLCGISITRPTELLIGTVVLVAGAYAVHRCARSEATSRPRALSGTLIVLTMLASTYHQTYDAVVLTLPLTALIANRWTPGAQQPLLRGVLVAAMVALALNYLASVTAIYAFKLYGNWRLAATSINPSAVCLALLIYLGLAMRRQNAGSS
jgi:hypothetical protein